VEHPSPARSLVPAQRPSSDADILAGYKSVDKTVTLNGVSQIVKLYGLSVLASMLNRSVKTLVKWIGKGILPLTPYQYSIATAEKAGNKHAIRYGYSANMILETVRIARETGVLFGYNAQVTKTQFPTRVKALFELERRSLLGIGV
jgi:hypothetical protein